MTRQSATQHLDILGGPTSRPSCDGDGSGFTTSTRHRSTSWRSAGFGFDKPRLQAISAIKNQAEEYAMTDGPTSVPTYVYVTYIRASAEQVWQALTDADLTARYWGHANISDSATRFDLGASTRRRLRRRRCRRSCAQDRTSDTLGHHLRGHPRRRNTEGNRRSRVPRRTARGHRPPHRDPRESPQPGDARRHCADGRPCWRTSSRCSRPAMSSRRRHGRCLPGHA